MTSATLPAESSPADWLAAADRLQQEGRLVEAAEALEQIDRAERDPMVDVRILDLRHRAGHALRTAALASPAAPPADPVVDPVDPFPGTIGAPEVAAADLDESLLRAAIRHHGCLIVRGLLDPERCARLRADLDQAFDAYDARAWKPVDQTAPWYANLELDESEIPLDPLAGAFLRSAGGVYAPCAPRAFVDYRRALADAGLIGVVSRYLGDAPLLSVNKCVLRRIGGGASPSWHQDGLYFGVEVNAVNLWLSLSRCGGDTDVMGMDLLPGPRDDLAPMGTHDAVDPRAVAHQVVEDLAAETGRPIIRPVFEPGDAILFDHLFLHRSDVRPVEVERYAIEAWFFDPATCPDHQIPIAAS